MNVPIAIGRLKALNNTILVQIIYREVAEWLKALPWKGSIGVTLSRVRISSSLPKHPKLHNAWDVLFLNELKIHFQARVK